MDLSICRLENQVCLTIEYIPMKKILFGLILVTSFLVPVEDTHGQLKEIEQFLDAGGDNVDALTKAYLSPLPNGIISGLKFRLDYQSKTHQITRI